MAFMTYFYTRILGLFCSVVFMALLLNSLPELDNETILSEDKDNPAVVDKAPVTLTDTLDPSSQFKPEHVIGPGRMNATYVFGIPHVKRKGASYLLSTLKSLLTHTPPYWRERVLFVVLLADTDNEYTAKMVHKLQSTFGKHIDTGLLQLLLPNGTFYPEDWKAVQKNRPISTETKSIEENHWFAKQNYDFAYLMLYCRRLGKFYVQMEDDVYTRQGYIDAIDEAVSSIFLARELFVMEFSSLGFIGKLFHSDGAVLMARYLRLLAWHRPGDVLLMQLVHTLACLPQYSKYECSRAQDGIRYRHKPSLFQHRGFVSSLKTRVQLLQDNFY